MCGIKPYVTKYSTYELKSKLSTVKGERNLFTTSAHNGVQGVYGHLQQLQVQAATLLEFMYHSRIVLSVVGSVWYMIRNLRCTVTIDSVWANSKTQNAFLFTVNAIFFHDYPLAMEPGSTPRPPVQKKKTWRDSLPIDILLSAVSVLVVAQSSSEIPDGLMNNPVLLGSAYKNLINNMLVAMGAYVGSRGIFPLIFKWAIPVVFFNHK